MVFRTFKMMKSFSKGIQIRHASQVRVRFAPSPTGNLHLGGLRTALYNYIYARQHNGRFILRIEDTDQSRLVPGATEDIIEDLTWMGMRIGEGPNAGGDFGPYIQSQRLNLYTKHVNQLIKTGKAYHCFCTEQRLDLLRKQAKRSSTIAKYDNRCRSLKPDEAQMRLKRGDTACVRFKLTTDPDCCQFDDLIYGTIRYNVMQNEGDPIIMKSDGFPTYHIANVIDDHLMQISHVLRGVEWQISTIKHLMIYKAFSWKPPIYGHLPLLVDSSGNKLSKRQQDISIRSYREKGIFPNALINYITTTGGGFLGDHERGIKPKCYTIPQLTLRFNISDVKPSPGRFDEARLTDFNQIELRTLCASDQSRAGLVKIVQSMIRARFADKDELYLQLHTDHVDAVLNWSVDRIHSLSDLVSNDHSYLWCIPDYDVETFKTGDAAVMRLVCAALENKQLSMDKQAINRFLQNLAIEYGYSVESLMLLTRRVLSGLSSGPAVAEMLVVLGRANSILRLRMFVEKWVALASLNQPQTQTHKYADQSKS